MLCAVPMGADTSLIFSRTGPSFLTALNWNESQHRRSVAASLVQGVFAMERDRQENRNGVGPPWWQFFNFRLVQNLVDQVDASHYGAVYEFIDFPGHCHNHRPPQFVVAFRGSSNRFANWEQDLNLNLLLSLDTIQSSSRVRRGLESAHRFVCQAGPENVWLAGHSIGSSLALAVGRQMAKQGHYLETYLFNPPFSSPPIGRLTSSELKFGLRLANSLLTAGLATAAARCNQGQEADTFFELSTWFPYLFINPSDPICSEYVGYFKHREDMESIGAGEIERIATKHSKRSIVLSAAGEKDCEPVHRIPSAHLILNLTPSNSFKEAHGIHQWWRQDLQVHYEYHQYNYIKQNLDPNEAIAPDSSEIFTLTGPSFLTDVDWNNSHHRSSIVASLVHGVYCLESDRRHNRQGPQVFAPPWWQFFNFNLIQVLVDNQDGSFFGAIYELVDTSTPIHAACRQKPPRYVIAFRGTINKGKKEQEHRLNLQLIINSLVNSPRFRLGLDSTSQAVQHAGPGNVWLAGHALGSSIALLVGKQMVKSGFHLETYLYNPPFASPHIERIKNEKVKQGLRFSNSLLTACIAAAVCHKSQDRESDPFVVLSSWVPYLFVNSSDPICSEYVGYFKHREDMESMGAAARKIGRLATKHSVRDVFAVARGKTDSEAVHIIPSAFLTINAGPALNFREAHVIHQWWSQDLQLHYKFYQYK